MNPNRLERRCGTPGADIYQFFPMVDINVMYRRDLQFLEIRQPTLCSCGHATSRRPALRVLWDGQARLAQATIQ